ncbi:MAG: SDR family NAD(P)-dependent oxidoreductase [bacterium]
MEIKNKIVIVTGASAGIGLATARLLSEKGARIALAARREELLKKLSEELPDSFVIPTDMRIPESVENMIDETSKHYGRIDILINNAGRGIYGAVENADIDGYREVIDLNVIGPLIAMLRVIPMMREQGGGMIVNISSLVSKNYFPFLGIYASTKYALNALSLTARTELQKDNIIVSVVHPGMTATDFGKNAIKMEPKANAMESRHREGMPEPDSAEHVAGRILLAIETGEAEVFAHDR